MFVPKACPGPLVNSGACFWSTLGHHIFQDLLGNDYILRPGWLVLHFLCLHTLYPLSFFSWVRWWRILGPPDSNPSPPPVGSAATRLILVVVVLSIIVIKFLKRRNSEAMSQIQKLELLGEVMLMLWTLSNAKEKQR